MKQTILFLRNGSLYANRSKAIEGLNSVTHKAGQPVVALYGTAGSVELIMAIGTENGKYKIVQEGLISGTNIKTVNGTSILGSGDLSVGNIVAEDTTDSIEDFTTESVSFWETLNNEIERAQNAEQEAIIKAKDQTLRTLYIAAGAEYNATGKIIVKDTPWKNNVDSAEYKAQWNIDVLSGTVDTVTYGGKTYEYLVDTDGTWKIITRVGDKMIWDDTKVIHRPGYYYLNGLGDITEEQMLYIYNIGRIVSPSSSTLFSATSRNFVTNIPTVLNGGEGTAVSFYYICASSGIKVFRNTTGTKTWVSDMHNAWSSCSRLRHIVPIIDVGSTTNATRVAAFYNCLSLVTCHLCRLKYLVSFSYSPLISKYSIVNTIKDANPTTPITITLHADAYARLKDDTDIITALEEKNAALKTEGKGGSVSLVSA